MKELGPGVAGQVVLLAPGGRQLQRQEAIASYGAGTVGDKKLDCHKYSELFTHRRRDPSSSSSSSHACTIEVMARSLSQVRVRGESMICC